jgi:hypothetical protein
MNHSIDVNDVPVTIVTRNNIPQLYLKPDTRDLIGSVNVFMVMLRDMVQDDYTRLRLDRTIRHLSDMLYGFEDDEN